MFEKSNEMTSKIDDFHQKFENIDHVSSPLPGHSSLHRIFLDMAGISFESCMLLLCFGQFSANSIGWIKSYDEFCQIFKRIVTDHFDARFALVLFYKILLFEWRKQPFLCSLALALGPHGWVCVRIQLELLYKHQINFFEKNDHFASQ